MPKRTPGDRVTKQDKEKILAVYSQTKSIYKTSEITGWSASTVNKYVKDISIWRPASRNFPGHVIQKDINGKMVNVFRTAKEAAEVTGISESNICHCISGKTKLAGGFSWSRIYAHQK